MSYMSIRWTNRRLQVDKYLYQCFMEHEKEGNQLEIKIDAGAGER